MKLHNRVALITGAGSGIGAATARLMVTEGAKVAVTGIPFAGVEAVTAQLTAAGHSARALPLDVADPQQVAAAVQQTVAHFGRLDIVSPMPASNSMTGMSTCMNCRKRCGIRRTMSTTAASISPVKRAWPSSWRKVRAV